MREGYCYSPPDWRRGGGGGGGTPRTSLKKVVSKAVEAIGEALETAGEWAYKRLGESWRVQWLVGVLPILDGDHFHYFR